MKKPGLLCKLLATLVSSLCFYVHISVCYKISKQWINHLYDVLISRNHLLVTNLFQIEARNLLWKSEFWLNNSVNPFFVCFYLKAILKSSCSYNTCVIKTCFGYVLDFKTVPLRYNWGITTRVENIRKSELKIRKTVLNNIYFYNADALIASGEQVYQL